MVVKITTDFIILLLYCKYKRKLVWFVAIFLFVFNFLRRFFGHFVLRFCPTTHQFLKFSGLGLQWSVWMGLLKVKRNSLFSYNKHERRPHFIRPRLSCYVCDLNLCRQKKRKRMRAQPPKGSVRYRAAVLKYYSMTSRLSTGLLVTACNNSRWTFWHSPH